MHPMVLLPPGASRSHPARPRVPALLPPPCPCCDSLALCWPRLARAEPQLPGGRNVICNRVTSELGMAQPPGPAKTATKPESLALGADGERQRGVFLAVAADGEVRPRHLHSSPH